LHYKPWSSIKPEYFAEQTDRWIIYFWEMAETAKYLKEKLKKENFSESEINRILKEEIGIPEYIIKFISKNNKLRE
jgi:hypoxanthine phosphoribosyltransferase